MSIFSNFCNYMSCCKSIHGNVNEEKLARKNISISDKEIGKITPRITFRIPRKRKK
jgi:hypothetical protein